MTRRFDSVIHYSVRAAGEQRDGLAPRTLSTRRVVRSGELCALRVLLRK